MKTFGLNDLSAPKGIDKAHEVLEAMRAKALERAQPANREREQENEIAGLAISLIPGIEGLVEANPAIREHDYMMCYRSLTCLLPEAVRFTAHGTIALNRAMAASPDFAWKMENHWKQISEMTISGAVKQDERKRERYEQERNAVNAEDQRVIQELQEVLSELLYAKPVRMSTTRGGAEMPLVKHYSELLKFLRSHLKNQYRGIRSVRCIHTAMLAQLVWSEHWGDWMRKDIEFYERREKEFIERMKSSKRKRKNTKPESVTTDSVAVDVIENETVLPVVAEISTP